MVRYLPNIIAICALLLGVAHIAIGIIIYPALDLDALWFHGSGLAMSSVAASNLATHQMSGRTSYLIIIQNLVMTGYFALALTVLPAIQVAAGFLLFALLALFSVANHCRNSRTSKAGIDAI